METIAGILDFWFGSDPDDAVVAREHEALWWGKDGAADVRIRERFEDTVLAAEASRLDAWRSSSEGLLALILLCDQFPRSMYRGTPAAFRFDPLARSLCLWGLEGRFDRQLRPVQRVFCYLPLEHSEDLKDQHRSVALFRELADEVPAAWGELFTGYLDYALRHKVIIERFGRFPHRNAILGRASTPEERDFLQGPDSSF